MGCGMNAQYLNSVPPDGVVALSEDGALHRDAFWRRVNTLADAIAHHPAQRWALICKDSSWFAAGLFALANSARTIVLPPAPQAGSIVASDARVDAVLTDQPEQFPGFESLSTREPAASALSAPRMPDDAVCIEFYTSGSTGESKCVPKTFVQLRLEVAALEHEWGPQLGDAVMAGTVPHYHLYGLLFRILWPVLSGRAFLTSMCLHPPALRAVVAQGRSAIVSSPAFLGRIGDCAELPPAAGVAALFSSGAPLPDATAEKLASEWGRAAIEVYGSTETGGVAWRSWSGTRERAAWRPIQGVDIAVREETAGDRLWVRSGCTWQGDWMPTGDLARSQADGRFVLLGRADDVVKFEDKRISLSEMRTRLITHAWVRDARLLLLQGRRTLIGAVVILNAQGHAALVESGRTAVRESLRGWLRNSYEPVLLPRKWRFVDELPDNHMGKIEYVRLQGLFERPP
jgi:acyl-coenzyme A synthetase/AMP-(fatty) acid ligase